MYRDRFENLETPPPQESWENIIAGLPNRKKKRIFPFWYQLAGTAAVVALLVSLYNIFLPQDNYESTQTISFESKKKALYSDPVSENFQETMRLSSTVLENLKIETLKNLIEKGNIAKSANTGQHNDPAGTPEVEIKKITPLINNSPSQSINSQISGIEKSREERVENSLLADDPQIDQTLRNIEHLAQTDPEKEKEADKPGVEKTNLKRLSIRPTAGAVYFDNLSQGNSLDPAYANNKSSGEFTMAYGLNLAYTINSKWNIRTGINKIDLSHNTSNIEFGVAIESSGLNPQFVTPLLASSDASNGYLNQSIEYIEIPLEFELALVDKKMGLNIIGGASTFLLDGNMISHTSPFAKTELGEANNLNDVSFSANIGLGLNYNFSSQFQFNLEPILKYQINTYKTGSGLTPYIFGIYSGLSFHFN